jgi:hypothetical protein
MKSILKKLYSMPVFMLTLWVTGNLIRIPRLAPLVRATNAALGRLVVWTWSERHREDVVDIATAWTDLMPSPKSKFPILKVEDGIAFGEIHVHCPLRGTGNNLACFHLMEFDRSIITKLGGELVVTESQSTSGRDYCTVAIKKKETEWKSIKSAWPTLTTSQN